jgi:transcriptional regulator with XRE-family HTH domain
MLSVSPVNLDLADRMRDDPEFRAEFFRLAAQETIASQIRFLRELRQLRQADLAKMTGMKQSAISRIEKADYASWNYATLVRLAEALDARLRVTFEPSEDVIRSLEGATGNGLLHGLKSRRDDEQVENSGEQRGPLEASARAINDYKSPNDRMQQLLHGLKSRRDDEQVENSGGQRGPSARAHNDYNRVQLGRAA